MHPLTPARSELTDEQIENKISEIINKITLASRISPASVIPLQQILEDYTFERNQRTFNKMLELEEQEKGDLFAPMNIGEGDGDDDGDNKS